MMLSGYPKEDDVCRQRQQVIYNNVQELLQAGTIKRIDYLVWLVNHVIVPKHNGI